MSSTKPELPILLTIGFSHYRPTSIHTHTHPLNGPFSGTTRVSRYQKGKTNLNFTEARDSEWQWHQLGHKQVCTSLQTDDHASTRPLSFFTSRMPFLPLNSVTALKANRPNSSHHNTLLAIPRVRRHQTLPPVWRCPLVSHSEQTPALLPLPMPGRGDYGQI